MPKKAIHKRRVVKKSPPKEEPQESQEDVTTSTVEEVQAVEENQLQTDPSQSSDVKPQASNMSSSPQNMPMSEPEPQVNQPISGEGGSEEKQETISAEESPGGEEESNEPIVAKDESGGGRGILKTIVSIIKYLFIFALGVAVGGFIVYQNGGNIDFLNKVIQKDESSQKVEVKPTAAPTEEPVDLTKYSIKVLNGSEIPGEASKLKDSLEEAGFKVSSIGNASESSFLKTVIMVKADVDEAFLEKLKDELLKSYELSDTEELEDSAEDDIEIIIGTEPQ
ncbi:MAG: LytR C-terminal domain-containing protein [Candidatus Levybacteria bacterium]|nr:LytR C-terminal domain-containing protein [Candidatus Levybacteria bacterium]